MTVSLIDRYVLTALRRVPEQQRSDIDRELRASIEDAVEARVDGGEPHDTAVRNTLLDLGDPDRLADRYADRTNFLIGPELYPVWRRFISMMFAIILPIVVVIGVVVQLVEDPDIGKVIGGAVTSILTVGAHLAFWTTFGFAVVERTGYAKAELRTTWSPDDLPKYEPNAMSAGTLASYLIWPVLLIAAIVLQQFTFTDVPVLDPAHWSSWWPFLIVVIALRAGWAVWTHRTGWTRQSAVVNGILAVLATAPVIWLLATGSFFNPAFGLPGGNVQRWITATAITVLVAGAIWDIVEVTVRAERIRRGLPVKIAGTGGSYDFGSTKI